MEGEGFLYCEAQVNKLEHHLYGSWAGQADQAVVRMVSLCGEISIWAGGYGGGYPSKQV